MYSYIYIFVFVYVYRSLPHHILCTHIWYAYIYVFICVYKFAYLYMYMSFAWHPPDASEVHFPRHIWYIQICICVYLYRYLLYDIWHIDVFTYSYIYIFTYWCNCIFGARHPLEASEVRLQHHMLYLHMFIYLYVSISIDICQTIFVNICQVVSDNIYISTYSCNLIYAPIFFWCDIREKPPRSLFATSYFIQIHINILMCLSVYIIFTTLYLIYIKIQHSK